MSSEQTSLPLLNSTICIPAVGDTICLTANISTWLPVATGAAEHALRPVPKGAEFKVLASSPEGYGRVLWESPAGPRQFGINFAVVPWEKAEAGQ